MMFGNEVRIAITGTEGAGKSVFITTFAKYIERLDHSQGWALSAKTIQTQQYVDQHWKSLRGGEWPPLTMPGTYQSLSWKLIVPSAKGLSRQAVDLTVIDPAGHDFRSLYANDELFNGPIESLPSDIRALADNFRQAHIMFVLVNLQDFIGEKNALRRTTSQMAIKFAVDQAKSNGQLQRVFLLISQIDQYPGIVEQYGDWEALVRKCLPNFAAIHLDHICEIIPIAAVDQVEIRTSSDGVPVKFPGKNFGSVGYSVLLGRLQQVIPPLKYQVPRRAIEIELKKYAEIVRRTTSEYKRPILAGIGFLLLWLVIVRPIWGFLFPADRVSVQSANVEYEKRSVGFFSHDIYYDPTVKVTLINNGGEGDVTLRATLMPGVEEIRRVNFKKNEMKVESFEWRDPTPNDEPVKYNPKIEILK